jgi:hypothetical protein
LKRFGNVKFKDSKLGLKAANEKTRLIVAGILGVVALAIPFGFLLNGTYYVINWHFFSFSSYFGLSNIVAGIQFLIYYGFDAMSFIGVVLSILSFVLTLSGSLMLLSALKPEGNLLTRFSKLKEIPLFRLLRLGGILLIVAATIEIGLLIIWATSYSYLFSGLWASPIPVGAILSLIAGIIPLFPQPKKDQSPAISPISPTQFQLRVSVEPKEIPADGISQSVITVQLMDSQGKPTTAFRDTMVRISAEKGKLEKTEITIQKGKDKAEVSIVSSKEGGAIPVLVEADGIKNAITVLTFLEKKRYCMHCGTQMKTKTNACPNCGKLPPAGVDTKQCQNCSETLPISAKFCSKCGAGQKQ